jgi:S-DNA-T family DNA segregation ATPase FtsK/SpoIIIE
MATADAPYRDVEAPAPPQAGRSPGRAASAARLPVEAAPATPPRDRVRDITALVLLAASTFVLASLASFDAADPPVPHAFPPNARVFNACGAVGSFLAGQAYRWLGIAAWIGLALVAALDVALLRRRVLPDLPLRTVGAVIATVGSATLLAMFLPDSFPRPVWGPGGAIGAIGRLFAEGLLAHTGAAIVVSGITAAGLFLVCDTALVRLAAFVASIGSVIVGALAALLSRRKPVGVTPEGAAVASVAAPAEPTWWQTRRGAAKPIGGVSAEDDESEAERDAGDDADSQGPTIKVRKPPARPAPEDSTFEADDIEDGLDNADDDESSEVSSVDAPAAMQVPIKSLASRRRPMEVNVDEGSVGADYELPSLELLLPTEHLRQDEQESEVRERARMLEKTFAEFGFKVRVVEIETGPVISQYEIELEAGLRLAKIVNLADDLAIALRVPSVRIVAPIPGKNSVGIEVPNTIRQMVRLREVMEEAQAKAKTLKIPLFLGKDVAGNPMVVDMASMPHLLIAGRTGTGKSVCLNSLILSMIMTRRPDEVRMLMIDPKMVELTPYKSLPHLMHPVVTDMKKAEAILAWAVEKMEERYALLAKVGVRHLTGYNALGRDELIKRIGPETDEEAAAIPTTMPFIVVIADEIADMMMTAGKEIEQHIIRLAQKSRAVGIHLVLATQKPTVDVITGLIKSNLPARIAFQVASRTDSRVVLDECGADRLLGNGDMLFLSPGTSQILRGQGTYLSDEEITRVMAAVGTSEPQYAAELVNLQPAPSGDAASGASPKDKDDMYDAAVEVVIREGRGSVSLLQRALGVGYGRGARLIDFMAEDGVVGLYAGSQAREILLTMEQWEAKKAARNAPVSPSPRRLKVQPHDDGKGEPAGKPSRAKEKPAKRKPARGVDMTAHAASMKPVPGAAAAPGSPLLPTLPSIAVRPLGVSPHDADDDEDDDHDVDIAIPGGRANLGRQVVVIEEHAEDDQQASGEWDDASEAIDDEATDDEVEGDDAFAEEDESESFIVDSDDPAGEVDGDGDEDDEDEDEDYEDE